MKTRLLSLLLLLTFLGCSASSPEALSTQKELDEEFISAVNIATTDGNLQEMRALLQKGANINYRRQDQNAYNALDLAAITGKVDVLKALITEHADVNLKRKGFITALYEATQMGHVNCVNALLEASADVNARDDAGLTALHIAAGHEHSDCLRALIARKDIDVNARNNGGVTALHQAIIFGRLVSVKTLIAAKADLNARTSVGSSALHYATSKRCPITILKALLEANADIAIRDERKLTALHAAIGSDRLDVVKELVKHSYLLAPSASDARKRIYPSLLLFVKLGNPVEKKGEGLKDFGNYALRFSLLSNDRLFQDDLVLILLDELKKGRKIQPGLLSLSKYAVIPYLLRKLNEMLSQSSVSAMTQPMNELLDNDSLEKLIREGLQEKYSIFHDC